MKTTTLMLVAVAMVACGGVEREPFESGDASVRADAGMTDSGSPDASRPPPYDQSCEPSREACQAALDACVMGADFETTTACISTASECYVAELESKRACFESFACNAALDSFDCVAQCETEHRECLPTATNPSERERCTAAAERCHRDVCGVDRWRTGVSGTPEC